MLAIRTSDSVFTACSAPITEDFEFGQAKRKRGPQEGPHIA